MSRAAPRIRLAVSSCLLGEEVRYDGGHKRDRFLTDTLAKYFELVPVCPEVAIGLGVPREPIQLRRTPRGVRVVAIRGPARDVTDALGDYARRMAAGLGDICGYVLKSRSPSCGMERVKVYPAGDGPPTADGVGEYARVLMTARPLLPVEEEGRLQDPVLRENFIERVFTLHRWQELAARGVTAARLVDFHSRHKLAVMAHGALPYQRLGRLLANAGKRPAAEIADHYIALLMTALRRPATRRGHANVLQHLQGYLKKALDRDDRAELADTIDRYRRGLLPLIVPITLLDHHFRRAPDPYVAQQVYLHPHPPELMLRNLI